ncbi:type IV pilus modification PilV family protein [Dermatobacter hominis]|uniref:type IV pilus modification PilV family protein n=1 Tax=Dermatobacter hominis TaxID=2884263 RepID=UPI001D1122F9|nr:prepilin-type N-terminal cleavage/methylation domain-containing protein [Dermatobacter hominis]UDY37313.1 prepilin-type N-terminal cleavage/methylation domain-containing protein [Dermatobacter hominis]
MAADVPRRRSQRGESLIESLIAIVVLSLVVGAAYAGLRTALRVSSQHKETAVAETMLRTAAERLQDPASAYVPRAGCGGVPTYGGLPTRPGYKPIEVTVRFWNKPSTVTVPSLDVDFAEAGSCPATDPGLQAIVLSVETPSGHVERLEIVKRAS